MSRTIFHLREIAHSRAGDKGDTSNVSVIAYRDEFFQIISTQVTVDAVRSHFGTLVRGRITRYPLPQFSALNIVLEESLGGAQVICVDLPGNGRLNHLQSVLSWFVRGSNRCIAVFELRRGYNIRRRCSSLHGVRCWPIHRYHGLNDL